ncbi:PepSY domain-containing protein [Pseudomonas sp. gcc21]|uniref:PepSY-associated TM helix domain-containing protein n=1 Tax=Pseudomonas sp. gcc21 TaxID=2726989 RepID=UPI0014528CAB|nr:PepSY-associated TM helix domain-containing protein [Pseudomonas sp. gcc21]QJD57829.1 PepSY domain-containing protein [Pseudomonas sp. gcc21]
MPSVSRVGISDTDTPRATESSKLLLALVARLHFYAGVLIGPFILVAALSGLLYALTPQLENWLYSEHLYTESHGPVAPLGAQIEAAETHLGESGLRLAAVRPAPGAGQTTRVMFAADGLDASEHKAVFIDPVTAEPRGDLIVYGTTGVLPLRNWIGDMHRRLFLGDWGRLYSEMAASWLWLIALGGLTIWLVRRKQSRSVEAGAPTGLKQWHGLLGVILLLALLFFSATGLTWSKWAGGNIGVVRAAFGMSTPGLSTQLAGQGSATGAHHNHQQREPTNSGATVEYALIDNILLAARASGINANKLEITPARTSGEAWSVVEIDRSWPTQVDAVAIDPRSMTITDELRFAEFPLAGKLTRWGIDAHMGSLFGLANQIILIVSAAGAAAMVVLGYLIWWRRRPLRSLASRGVVEVWTRLSLPGKAGTTVFAVLLGVALPVFGLSLLLLLVIDMATGLSTKSEV